MKKYLIYIVFLLMSTAIWSCKDDIEYTSVEDSTGDTSLHVRLSLPDVPTTRMQSRGAVNEVLEQIPSSIDADYLKKLDIYVFVFEDAGSPETNYLREVAYGEDDIKNIKTGDDTEHEGNNALIEFDVSLIGTVENAIVHIVATSDPEFKTRVDGFNDNLADRSELGIMTGSSGLYTSGNYDAYWSRVPLDMMIGPENKTLLEAKLRHVNMVRNYARITLKVNVMDSPETPKEAKTFIPDGYILVNTVTCGYVAAYNSLTREFMKFDDVSRNPLSYGQLTETSYSGMRHPESERVHREENPDEWIDKYLSDEIWNNDAKYTFERPYQNQHRTYILLKGHFTVNESQEKTRYIKLDIGNVDGMPEGEVTTNGPFGLFETYNLLRNISYDVEITAIRSTDVGEATLRDALASPPANNVSTSVDTRSLRNIYDGIDHMEVNETTIVVVDDENGDPHPKTYDIMWRYWEDYNSTNTQNNAAVRWVWPGYNNFELPDRNGVIATITAARGDGYMQGDRYVVENGVPEAPLSFEATDEKGNWSGFILTFQKPTDIPKQKTIRLFKPGGLSRDINIILRNRWRFVNNSPEKYSSDIEVYAGHYSFEDNTIPPGIKTMDQMREWLNPDTEAGKVGSHRGAQLTVMFELPSDLPEAIFPLEFKIGADRQNIENAYVGNAAVTTGPSLFENDPDPVGVMRIQFVKTVTWDDYNGTGDKGSYGRHIVAARFLTTTDVHMVGEVNEEAKTRVRVTNPYFYDGNDSFERHSFEDVVDPSRKSWYWNFSHTEWTNFFASYPSASDSEDHTLNDLHFKNYTSGKTNDGTYMEIDSEGTYQNPDYTFPVRFPIEELEGALVIKATPGKARTGTTNRQWYDREISIALKAVNPESPGEAPVYLQLPDDKVQACTQNGGNLPLRTLEFNLADVISAQDLVTYAGYNITEVIIWSKQIDNSRTDNPTKQNHGPTRYYSIMMTR